MLYYDSGEDVVAALRKVKGQESPAPAQLAGIEVFLYLSLSLNHLSFMIGCICCSLFQVILPGGKRVRASHLQPDNTLWEVFAWLHEDETCQAAIAGKVRIHETASDICAQSGEAYSASFFFPSQSFTFAKGDDSGGSLTEEVFNNTLGQEGFFACGSLKVNT